MSQYWNTDPTALFWGSESSLFWLGGPIISLPSGTLLGPSQVAIFGTVKGPIFFTTDGSAPTVDSTRYSAPINVYYSQTIQAIQVVDGSVTRTSVASYTLDATRYPAPDAADDTSLRVNVDLPTVSQ